MMGRGEDREHILSERRKLRAMYKELFTEVAAILYELDPLNITFEGIAPSDEYEPEARTILPRLRSCSSVEDVRRVLYEEFVNWFGPDNAGSESNYHDAAGRIWAAWQRRTQVREST